MLTNVNPCSSICVVSCESASQKQYAEVAELADAQASGACGSNTVRVQVPPSALFIFCLKNSQSRLRVLFFYTLHDARVLCASGTCLAPTEAERRKDCGSATHRTFMSQTSARYK